MSKRAVIFGSSGQLGLELTQDLERRGYEVRGFERVHIDITDAFKVEHALADFEVNMVFNAAAYNQVDVAEREPAAAFAANALGVRNLALACRQMDACLVHFSTDYVFDGTLGRPYEETDATHPLGAYAVSKLAGELYAQAYLDNVLIVRTSGVFGPGGLRTNRGNFVELMLRLAAGGQPIRVVEDHVASPTYAPLLASRTIDLLEREETGVFHIGGGTPISWFDYARMIFDEAGVQPELHPTDEREYRTPARRPKFSALANARMAKAGLEPMPPLKDAVRKYMVRRNQLMAGESKMPELRKDPVTERWVIIATDRARRPADFSREHIRPLTNRFCPLCPGNESKTPPEVFAIRNGSHANQPGWTVRVIPNKFPVLGIEGELDRDAEGLYDRMNGLGAHEVIVETPDHNATLATMPESQVESVLWAFRSRVQDLKNDRRLRYILLFKNHGEAAGATLEHTHSQLIALPVVPKRAIEELEGAKRYFNFKERCIYCDLIRQESKSGGRVVTETDKFLVVEPYASRFPFETWIIPRRHQSHFEDIDGPYLQNLAWSLRSTLRKMDKVLENPAYNFVIQTAPVQDAPMAHYHWHFEIIPKLTKVAGFELATGFYINPTPPEEAAVFLREAGLG